MRGTFRFDEDPVGIYINVRISCLVHYLSGWLGGSKGLLY